VSDPEEKSLRSFTQFMTSLNYGKTHDELTDKVQEIVADLSEYRGDFGGKPKAKLIITLDFSLDDHLVEVSPTIKTKLPDRPKGKSMYFVTPENRLSREDPRQHKLPLDEIRERRNGIA